MALDYEAAEGRGRSRDVAPGNAERGEMLTSAAGWAGVRSAYLQINHCTSTFSNTD